MLKRLFAFLMVVCVIVCAAGCGGKVRSGQCEKMTKVILNEVAHSCFYAPLYVSMEQGYFEGEGIQLELVTGFGGDKTMTAVLSGEADIGFMGSEASIYAYQEGAGDYVVNFAQLTQRAGNFLVARNPIDEFEWEMLRGKKVLGGRAGGMPEMIFEFILEKEGIHPKTDVEIDQSIDFGSTAAAFSGGQGDYTIEFEPHATMLEQKKDGYVVASLGEDSGYVPYTAFSAKKSYIEEHPDIIQSFVNALQQGIYFVDTNSPEEIAKVIAPQFQEMDADTLTSIVERYYKQDTWKDNLVFEEQSFDLLINILEDAGVLNTPVPYRELINTEFAERAKSLF